MPEAFAVLAVFAIVVFIYVMMWLKSRDPAFHKPREELARLQHHLAWLKDRLAVAQRERWDPALQAGFVAQIEETARELGRVRGLLVTVDEAAASTAPR